MRLSLSNDETAVTSLVRLQKRLNFRVNTPPKAGQRFHNDTVVDPSEHPYFACYQHSYRPIRYFCQQLIMTASRNGVIRFWQKLITPLRHGIQRLTVKSVSSIPIPIRVNAHRPQVPAIAVIKRGGDFRACPLPGSIEKGLKVTRTM